MLSILKWTYTYRICKSLHDAQWRRQGDTSTGKTLKSIQGQNPAWCRANNHVAVLWINSSWPILSVEGGDCWEGGSGSGFALGSPGGRSRHLFTRVQQQGSFCPCAHQRTLTGQSMRGRRSRPLVHRPAVLKQNEWGSSNSTPRATPTATTGCFSLETLNKELCTRFLFFPVFAAEYLVHPESDLAFHAISDVNLLLIHIILPWIWHESSRIRRESKWNFTSPLNKWPCQAKCGFGIIKSQLVYCPGAPGT